MKYANILMRKVFTQVEIFFAWMPTFLFAALLTATKLWKIYSLDFLIKNIKS